MMKRFVFLALAVTCSWFSATPAATAELDIQVVGLDKAVEDQFPNDRLAAFTMLAEKIGKVKGDMVIDVDVWYPLGPKKRIPKELPPQWQKKYSQQQKKYRKEYPPMQKKLFSAIDNFCQSKKGKIFLIASAEDTLDKAQNMYRNVAAEAGMEGEKVPDCVHFTYATVFGDDAGEIYLLKTEGEIPHVVMAVLDKKKWPEDKIDSFPERSLSGVKIDQSLDSFENYHQEDFFHCGKKAVSLLDFQGSAAALTIFTLHSPRHDVLRLKTNRSVPGYLVMILGIRTMEKLNRQKNAEQ